MRRVVLAVTAALIVSGCQTSRLPTTMPDDFSVTVRQDGGMLQ